MTDDNTPENKLTLASPLEPDESSVDLSEWGPPPSPPVPPMATSVPPEMGDALVRTLQFDHDQVETCRIVSHNSRPIVAVKVKYLPHYEGLPEMSLATPGSSAVDLYAAIDEDIFLNTAENRVVTIPCGFCMELPSMVEAQIRPRSGLARKGVVAHFGTIDSDYRGEVQVILFNHSTTRFKIERGMRIAQMVISGNVLVPNLVSVEEINSTERGSGGFGSTGLK